MCFKCHKKLCINRQTDGRSGDFQRLTHYYIYVSVTPLDAARCVSLLHYCELLASVNTSCFRKYSHRCINNFPGYNIWTPFRHVIRQFRESFSGFLLPAFPRSGIFVFAHEPETRITPWYITSHKWKKNYKNRTVSNSTVSQSVVFRGRREDHFHIFSWNIQGQSFLSPSSTIVDLKKNMQSDILCFSMFADGTNLEHGPYVWNIAPEKVSH